MARKVLLHTFALGSPRVEGEGLRISVARRPQRGVRLAELRRAGQFDSWLPQLAPSAALLQRTPRARFAEAAVWARFAAAYEREMAASEPRHLIAFLAQLACHTPLSLGCFCAAETHCHRRLLARLIRQAAAESAL